MRLFLAMMWVSMGLVGLVGCGGSGEGDSNASESLVVSGPGGATSAVDSEGNEETGTSSDVTGEKPEGEAREQEQEEEGGEENDPVACEPFAEGQTQVSGQLYVDGGDLSLSVHEGVYNSDEDSAIDGHEVRLLPEDLPTATCDDGSFSFNDVPAGIYVVDLGTDVAACSTRNCATRFPQAIREGEVRITTFGDSVPKVGSNVLFPTHLADTVENVAAVVSNNVAVPGSKSVDWTPGTYNFEEELRPILAETDVLIASIGGNDVTAYAAEVMGGGNIAEALDGGVNDKLKEILANVLSTFEEAREINPDIDLIYCLYPNYANSDQWSSFLGGIPGVGDLVANLIVDALNQVRVEMPMDQGLILVDMYGALGDEDITDILYDELHFNDVGHQLYAAEIFKALGGVEVTADGAVFVDAGLLGDE